MVRTSMNSDENQLERLIAWVNQSESLLLRARQMSSAIDERVHQALRVQQPIDLPSSTTNDWPRRPDRTRTAELLASLENRSATNR
jgi:hypothetical protein